MAYACIDCGSFTIEHCGVCGEPLCSTCGSRSSYTGLCQKCGLSKQAKKEVKEDKKDGQQTNRQA
jgi:hypothetical protein